MEQNIATWERYLRFALGILALEAAYFWLATPWAWVAYAVGAVLIVTAVFRACPLYRLAGRAPVAAARAGTGRLPAVVALIVIVAIAAGGAYASMFLTRKMFLEDFNAMNQHYKQTPFLTGQARREEAIRNFDLWKPAFEAFRTRYSLYRPHDLKRDGKLASDFEEVAAILARVEPMVRTGDLHEAHLALEEVRPIFQDTFKRNGFSLLAVALVDFHDAMETILAAASSKDAAQVGTLYPQVSDKLKAVEAEADDADIKAIRAALDALYTAAQSGENDRLPDLGSALKSSFVKVYLQRG